MADAAPGTNATHARAGEVRGPVRVSWGLRLRYALASLIFFLGYRVFGLRRAVIRGNLERSFPDRSDAERRQIRREFIRRQSQVLAEIDYARRMPADEFRQRVRLIDATGVLAASRQIVIVGAHQCNFEWLLLRLSLELGAGMVCLYKPLRGPGERYFHELRTRFGSRLLPSKSVTKELGTIRNARALGLVADQVPRTSPERHWTNFLRQPTAFFKGPERLARLMRAQVVYVCMRRLERGEYEVTLEPLTTAEERKLPPGTIMERYARVLERDIDADPAGWWWSHKRWKIKAPEPGATDEESSETAGG